jgi:hypothetical protein
MWLLATNHTSVTGAGMTSKCIVHAGVACRHVNLLGTACAPPASMREKTTITMMSITTAHTCVHLSPRAERCAPITRLTEHTSASGRPGACPPAPACAVTTTTCSRPSMAASARAGLPLRHAQRASGKSASAILSRDPTGGPVSCTTVRRTRHPCIRVHQRGTRVRSQLSAFGRAGCRPLV